MMPVSAIFWPLSAIFLAVESSTAHSYRGESGTPVSDSGPILRHRSGPSSQLSGPIAGFLACVEDAQRLRLPSAPSPPAGAYRFAPDPVQKSESEKEKRSEAKCFLSHATRLAQQKLFTISKFRLIFVALIPVINYNAQIVFKI